MTDPLKKLQRMQREVWADELDLREQAKTDPWLAEMLADADRQYEDQYGTKWVNPLEVSA